MTLWDRIKQFDSSQIGLFLCILVTVVQLLLLLQTSVNSCQLINSDNSNNNNSSTTIYRLEALARELYSVDDRVFILEKRVDTL